MASSTNSPIATARPPSVIVLIESPHHAKTRHVMMIDIGIARSVMTVVRRFSRNIASATATRIAPSHSASITFATAKSMNSRC